MLAHVATVVHAHDAPVFVVAVVAMALMVLFRLGRTVRN